MRDLQGGNAGLEFLLFAECEESGIVKLKNGLCTLDVDLTQALLAEGFA